MLMILTTCKEAGPLAVLRLCVLSGDLQVTQKVLVAHLCPLFATLQTVARQAPLSMGFSRQEYWSGLPWPSPGHLPDPVIEPGSPALQTLITEPPGKRRNLARHLHRPSSGSPPTGLSGCFCAGGPVCTEPEALNTLPLGRELQRAGLCPSVTHTFRSLQTTTQVFSHAIWNQPDQD